MIRTMLWVSVDDALPKPKTPCLTYTNNGICAVRKMNAHKFSEFSGNRVTHWMPLPESPNKDRVAGQVRAA